MTLYNIALSDRKGKANLRIPKRFDISNKETRNDALKDAQELQSLFDEKKDQINGKIWYITRGDFKNDIRRGNKGLTSISLKKLISSNKFKIKSKVKKTKLVFNKIFKNIFKI